MAQQSKDLLSKLTDRGEGVIGKITELPGAQGLMDAVGNLPERLDDLTKRVRGLDALEKRIEELERRVSELGSGSAPKAKPRPASSSAGSGRARTTPRDAGSEKSEGAKRAGTAVQRSGGTGKKKPAS